MCKQKTILITGATSGIGLETALYLYEQGYNLLLIGRDEKKLRQLSKKVGDAVFFVIDLEFTDRIVEIADFCKKKDIQLDGMVYSAGYVVNVPIRALNIEHAEKQMKIHYYSFIELCKHFYSRKISNDGASIVAISSLATVTKKKGSVLYSASKSALNAAVSVTAKEFLKRAIRVNAIMPAYVDTRMNIGLEELIDVKEQQPLGMIPAREIAYAVEFLLSDKSQYITGALIPISGGMEF